MRWQSCSCKGGGCFLGGLVGSAARVATGGAGLDEAFEGDRPDANTAPDANDFQLARCNGFINGSDA